MSSAAASSEDCSTTTTSSSSASRRSIGNSGFNNPPLTKTEMLERKFTLPFVSSPNFQIGNVSIVVVKQGPLHKTKLIENGKRHRKSWSNSHVVLTDTFLLFFKVKLRIF